jgi:hypothetical protein
MARNKGPVYQKAKSRNFKSALLRNEREISVYLLPDIRYARFGETVLVQIPPRASLLTESTVGAVSILCG